MIVLFFVCWLTVLSDQLILSRAHPFQGTSSKVSDAKADNYRFVVSISIKNYRNTLESDTHICGGSLISERHVLTAAHCRCEDEASLRHLRVKVGNHLNNPEAIFGVSAWKIFENGGFSCLRQEEPTYGSNDISVLTLSESIYKKVKKFIEIVDLNYSPINELLDYKTAVAVGWGSTVSVYGPTILQEATFNIISKDECERNIDKAPKVRKYKNGQLRSKHITLENNTLCTNANLVSGDDNNFLILGKGDSGSPLIVRNKSNQRMQIIAINEATSPWEGDNYVEWEQNLHVALLPYKDFIENIRKKSSADGYRTPRPSE